MPTTLLLAPLPPGQVPTAMQASTGMAPSYGHFRPPNNGPGRGKILCIKFME